MLRVVFIVERHPSTANKVEWLQGLSAQPCPSLLPGWSVPFSQQHLASNLCVKRLTALTRLMLASLCMGYNMHLANMNCKCWLPWQCHWQPVGRETGPPSGQARGNEKGKIMKEQEMSSYPTHEERVAWVWTFESTELTDSTCIMTWNSRFLVKNQSI